MKRNHRSQPDLSIFPVPRVPGNRITFLDMTMYWVYDLPTWLFGTLTVVLFVAFGLAGLYLLRGWVQRIDNGHHVYNHIVGFFLAGVTVLYAVTAGLLAIGAWATLIKCREKSTMRQVPLAVSTATPLRTPNRCAQPCRKTCGSTLVKSSMWDGRCKGTESFPTMRAQCSPTSRNIS